MYDLNIIRQKLELYENKIIDGFINRRSYHTNKEIYNNKCSTFDIIYSKLNQYLNKNKKLYKNIDLDDLDDLLKNEYINNLEFLCDENKNKSCTCIYVDINNINLILSRIYCGIEVIESKYSQNKDAFDKQIKNNNVDGIKNLLQNKEVEQKILNRVYEKTIQKTQNIKLAVNIRNFYQKTIIPLTIKIEIDYLFYHNSLESNSNILISSSQT
jgi:hypothetical protein